MEFKHVSVLLEETIDSKGCQNISVINTADLARTRKDRILLLCRCNATGKEATGKYFDAY